MTEKKDTIAKIIKFATKNDISSKELMDAIKIYELANNKKDISSLTRLFSYLGGIFVFSGLTYYICFVWNFLSSFSRILLVSGSGMIFTVLAVVSASKYKDRKYISSLVVLSAFFQFLSLIVAKEELQLYSGYLSVISLITLAIEYGIFFFKLRLTSFLFFTIFFASVAFMCFCDIIRINTRLAEFIYGVSLLSISYSIQKTSFNNICGFLYFVSTIFILWWGFETLCLVYFVGNNKNYLEIFYIGIASFMIYVSTIVRSQSMLVISTITLLTYIGYFTKKYFLNSIGWPIFLVLLGGILFGISGLVIRLNKDIKS